MVAIQPRISLFLGALDTTIMHRAGMAGLYMTLQRLEEKYPDPHQRAGHFLWKMTPDTIELSWQGSDVVALYWLLKESFKLDRKGLIHLTGIENNTTNLRQKIHIHEGICAVFLRHNKFFNATKLSTAKIRIETQEIDYKYKPLTWYSHQSFARTLCEINTGKLEKDYLQITSWLYLGGIVRHARASKTTKLEEKPEYAFALLFVPVICQYFLLNLFSEELKKKHPQRYLVVIPDVNNFERASQRRRELQRLSIEQFYVNSMEEAGLIYYSLDEDKEDEIHDRICQVLLYEKINQASRQRTLTRVEEIVIDRELLLTEKLIEQYFQPNFQRVSSKDILIKVNTVRSLIRENLVKRLPWWSNFWKKLVEDDQKGYLLKQLLYNKRGLKMMIENSDTTEKYLIFVNVFQHAMTVYFAKIYARTEQNKEPTIEKKVERLRAELNCCYDKLSFQQYLADFLARGGLNEYFYENKQEVLLLIEEAPWEKLRVWSLLAIASYKPKEKPPSTNNNLSIDNHETKGANDEPRESER